MTDPNLPPADTYVDEPPLTDDDLVRLYNTIDDYDELVAEDGVSAVDPGPAAAWAIDGPNTAAWAMTKLAAARAAITDAAERRDAYITRIVDAYTAETKRAARDAEFFTGHLIAYAIDVRVTSDHRTKTVITPAGTIKTTAHSAKAVVADPAAVIAWAKATAPAAVKTEESVLLTPLRDEVNIVEFPTRLVLTCGCVDTDILPAGVTIDAIDNIPAWVKTIAAGSARRCAQHDDDALIGQWLATTTYPVDHDGRLVPGVDIEPAHVTAKVVPA